MGGLLTKTAKVGPNESDHTPQAPEKTHLGDTAALKRALDDAAIEALRDAGYNIDYAIIDTKIALGVLACVIAGTAQFWPGKYPSTHGVLLFCVSLYTTFSILLSAFSFFVEKDTIAMTKTHGSVAALVLRSKMPRYQDGYTLAIRPRGIPAGDASEAKMSSSVGAYFDTEGVLAAEEFKADVAKLVAELTGGVRGGQDSPKKVK